MASFGRGAPRRAQTTEEADILTDLRTLTSLNGGITEGSISLDASVLIPEGGRCRPLMKITDYKIPKLGGMMEPDSAPQSAPKRVGKGRSRMPNKIREKPLNLGLNREFEMYNIKPCSDYNLPYFSHHISKSDTGYRLPYSPKIDEEYQDNSLSVRPKTKMPDFSKYDLPSYTNGHGVSSHSEDLQKECHEDQFYNSAEEHSVHNGNYDENILAKPSPTSELSDTSHLVSAQSLYNNDQFEDYQEVLSSKSRPSSMNEALATALNSFNGQTCQKNDPENFCLLQKTKEICLLTDTNMPNCLNNDKSCLLDIEISTTLPYPAEHVQPSHVKSASILSSSMAELDISAQDMQDNGIKSSRLDDSVPAKCQNNLPLDSLPDGKAVLVNSLVHDWWDDPGNADYNESKLPLSDNHSPTNIQCDSRVDAKVCHLSVKTLDVDSNDFRRSCGSQNDRQSPAIEKAATSIPTQEKQYMYSDYCYKPNLKQDGQIKPKLTSLTRAKQSQSKDGRIAFTSSKQDVQPRPQLGWGDVSYRNSLLTASSIHSAVSAHGDAENFSSKIGLNAFMKPIASLGPVFSMEEDFPALQSNYEVNNKTSSPTSTEDDWAKWKYLEEEKPCDSPRNASPEEPNQLNKFDQHSIVIENLPPNSDNILREFLEPFVQILSISVFSTDTGHIAYVKLENDEHCEWLIDCYDGCVPGTDWSEPLKIRKLK